MLEQFRGVLSTLKGAADNDVCVSKEVVYGLFNGDYEIRQLKNSIHIFCDHIKQNIFYVHFERVEDSNEYCINIIATCEPSEYLYARQ